MTKKHLNLISILIRVWLHRTPFLFWILIDLHLATVARIFLVYFLVVVQIVLGVSRDIFRVAQAQNSNFTSRGQMTYVLVVVQTVLRVSRAILWVASNTKSKLDLKRSSDLHLRESSEVAKIFLAYFLVVVQRVLGVSRTILWMAESQKSKHDLKWSNDLYPRESS